MDATELAGRMLRAAPANDAFGIVVEHAVDGTARATILEQPRFANIVGALHASGLVALVDACGLAAVISAVPDEARAERLRPLGRAAQLRFLAPAHGPLTATCTLTDEARTELARLQDEGRARFGTETTIADGDGAAVCCGRFEWSVRTG